jgi:hypothetical protein
MRPPRGQQLATSERRSAIPTPLPLPDPDSRDHEDPLVERPRANLPDPDASLKLSKAKASKKRRSQQEGKKVPTKKTRVDQFDNEDVQRIAPIARNHQKMQLITVDPFAEDETLQQFIANSWFRACTDFQLEQDLCHIIVEDASLRGFVRINSVP